MAWTLADSWVEVANFVPMKLATRGFFAVARLTSTVNSRKPSYLTIRPPIRNVSPAESVAANPSSISPKGTPVRFPFMRTFSFSVSWMVPIFILIMRLLLGSRSCHFPFFNSSLCQRS